MTKKGEYKYKYIWVEKKGQYKYIWVDPKRANINMNNQTGICEYKYEYKYLSHTGQCLSGPIFMMKIACCQDVNGNFQVL